MRKPVQSPRSIAALLRHGEYDQPEGVPSALLPYPLTEAGLAQAREAAGRLAEEAAAAGWALHPVIDTSRTLRAWQTATAVAETLGRILGAEIAVEEFEALAERSVGAAANLTVEQIENVLRRDPRAARPPRDWKRDSFYRLPVQGAESFLDAGRRVARHLEERMEDMAAAARVDTVKVFVGHGGSFRHAAARLGALSVPDLRAVSMYHCRPVYLERADAVCWMHVGGSWKDRRGELD